MLSGKLKARFLYGCVAIYPGSSVRHEMAEWANWQGPFQAGAGCKGTYRRKYSVFLLWCVKNHGAALPFDFRNFLHSKLLSAGTKQADIEPVPWCRCKYHICPAGNCDAFLLQHYLVRWHHSVLARPFHFLSASPAQGCRWELHSLFWFHPLWWTWGVLFF